MENKDTKTDYQEFVRVGDQKWEMVEIIIRIFFFFFFFFLRFIEIHIHYSIFYTCREFSSLTWEKSPPPKVPIPTQNPNLT